MRKNDIIVHSYPICWLSVCNQCFSSALHWTINLWAVTCATQIPLMSYLRVTVAGERWGWHLQVIAEGDNCRWSLWVTVACDPCGWQLQVIAVGNSCGWLLRVTVAGDRYMWQLQVISTGEGWLQRSLLKAYLFSSVKSLLVPVCLKFICFLLWEQRGRKQNRRTIGRPCSCPSLGRCPSRPSCGWDATTPGTKIIIRRNKLPPKDQMQGLKLIYASRNLWIFTTSWWNSHLYENRTVKLLLKYQIPNKVEKQLV